MRFYSIIVPVYNRPAEVDELLESLTHQEFTNFEVLIVEDGSDQDCKHIVSKYEDQLSIQYFFKENSGQGFSRNFGFERAKGDYLIVFDSDCIIPPEYLRVVETHLDANPLDAFGGPDKAHTSFTPIQKAISYSMTSVFTTGGIRGNKKHAGVFHPRSFNMGISRQVFESTKGYIITRMGEDIEFSIRIIENDFKTGLIEDAFVYHKRRTSLSQFYKQLHFFGRARINVRRFFPRELKVVHLMPLFFVLGFLGWLLSYFLVSELFLVGTGVLTLFFALIFLDASIRNRNIWIGIVSIATSFTQLFAYGVGMISEVLKGNK